jgi:predicted ABC-type ATPase
VKPALLVAGPNGAGKTTITTRLRQDHWSEGIEYLNPDDIARDRFGDWNSPEAVLKAAQWVSARRDELLAARQNLAFETVFSAPDKLDFLARARQAGYFSRVFFVSTSDPRINAARVAGRVMQGGHSVPIEKIVARYSRSMANLRVAFELADRVYVYDNSPDGADAVLGARIQDAQLRKIYGPLPAWIADSIVDLPRHPDFVDLRAA